MVVLCPLNAKTTSAKTKTTRMVLLKDSNNKTICKLPWFLRNATISRLCKHKCSKTKKLMLPGISKKPKNKVLSLIRLRSRGKESSKR